MVITQYGDGRTDPRFPASAPVTSPTPTPTTTPTTTTPTTSGPSAAQMAADRAGLSTQVKSQLAYMNTNPTNYGQVFNPSSTSYDTTYASGGGSSTKPYSQAYYSQVESIPPTLPTPTPSPSTPSNYLETLSKPFTSVGKSDTSIETTPQYGKVTDAFSKQPDNMVWDRSIGMYVDKSQMPQIDTTPQYGKVTDAFSNQPSNMVWDRSIGMYVDKNKSTTFNPIEVVVGGVSNFISTTSQNIDNLIRPKVTPSIIPPTKENTNLNIGANVIGPLGSLLKEKTGGTYDIVSITPTLKIDEVTLKKPFISNTSTEDITLKKPYIAYKPVITSENLIDNLKSQGLDIKDESTAQFYLNAYQSVKSGEANSDIKSSTIIQQPTGNIDIPFIGNTYIPGISDVNKYFQPIIKTETNVIDTPIEVTVNPDKLGVTFTGGKSSLTTSTPLPSVYDTFNKDTREFLHLPDPSSEQFKTTMKGAEVIFALNPTTSAMALPSFISNQVIPKVTNILPDSNYKTTLIENNKLSTSVTQVINPYSASALTDYYTPVYKEPLKGAGTFAVAAAVPLIGGSLKVAGVGDYLAASPRAIGIYGGLSQLVSGSMAAIYGNTILERSTGSSIGDFNKAIFGTVDEKPKGFGEISKTFEERGGVNRAVSEIRGIGVTEVVPMYYGFTTGGKIADVGSSYIMYRKLPELNQRSFAYTAKEGYPTSQQLTTKDLTASIKEGTLAFESGDIGSKTAAIKMHTTQGDIPLQRIPTGTQIGAEPGTINVYSGSETNYLKQGFVGKGYSEIEGTFVSPEGITYFAKPNAYEGSSLGIFSKDILGITREPLIYKFNIQDKVNPIPESVLRTKSFGGTNDPMNPRNIAISKYLETYGKPGEVYTGQYGKSEFQGMIRSGSEVKSIENVGYFKEGGMKIPVKEVKFTEKISEKYTASLEPKPTTIKTEPSYRVVGKNYMGADFNPSYSSSKPIPFITTSVIGSYSKDIIKPSSFISNKQISSFEYKPSSIISSKPISSTEYKPSSITQSKPISSIEYKPSSITQSKPISSIEYKPSSIISSKVSSPFEYKPSSIISSKVSSPFEYKPSSIISSKVSSSFEYKPTSTIPSEPYSPTPSYRITTSSPPSITIPPVGTGFLPGDMGGSGFKKFSPTRFTEVFKVGEGIGNIRDITEVKKKRK